MMAVLAIDAWPRLFGPGADGLLGVAQRAVERVAAGGDLARPSRGRDQRARGRRGRPRRTRTAPRRGEELGREAAQALLGAELEERVGLDAAPARRRGTARPATAFCMRSSEPAMRSKSALASRSSQGFGKSVSVRRHDRLGVRRRARRVGDRAAARGRREVAAELLERRSRCCAPPARRAAAASARCRRTRSARRVWNVIASWISKSRSTRPFATPRPYSTETSGVNVRTWPARRPCSLGRERRGAEARRGAARARRRAARRRPRARPRRAARARRGRLATSASGAAPTCAAVGRARARARSPPPARPAGPRRRGARPRAMARPSRARRACATGRCRAGRRAAPPRPWPAGRAGGELHVGERGVGARRG